MRFEVRGHSGTVHHSGTVKAQGPAPWVVVLIIAALAIVALTVFGIVVVNRLTDRPVRAETAATVATNEQICDCYDY
jgi:hypothetical protein